MVHFWPCYSKCLLNDPDKRSLYNVLLMSISLFSSLSAIRTFFNGGQLFFEKIQNDRKHFIANLNVGLCIMFGVATVSYWICPYVIMKLGTKVCIIWFTVMVLIQMCLGLYPVSWLMYVISVFTGMAVAVGYTSTGVFLTLNSKRMTIMRNTSVFWAITSTSMFFGNLIIHMFFKDKKLDHVTQRDMVVCVFVLAGIGMICMCLTKKETFEPTLKVDSKEMLLSTFKILKERDLLLLSLIFIYTGVEMAFLYGTYNTELEHTLTMRYEELEDVVSSGMILGVGTFFGGLIFGLLAFYFRQPWKQYPIMILACFIHVGCYIAIFINLPNTSRKLVTRDASLVNSNRSLALAISFLLGFGDSCINAQLYGKIASLYARNSAPAFSVFKFLSNCSMAVAYLASPLGLYATLAILLTFLIVGTINFCIVDIYPQRSDDYFSTPLPLQPSITNT